MLTSNPTAHLEHFAGTSDQNGPRIRLEPLPFRIGRGSGCQYGIASSEVSKFHTEILFLEGEFFIRDLDSTNGTFVNGKRVRESKLRHNDVIHVAREEFRFVCTSAQVGQESSVFKTQMGAGFGRSSIGKNRQFLQEMVSGYFGRAVFQPIVDIGTRVVTGYEALARGTHEQLGSLPTELFTIAERCGMASHLSEMFRDLAMSEVRQFPTCCRVFLNLHPFEICQDGLSVQLKASLRKCQAPHQVVLELNEEAILSLPLMRRVHAQVRELGMLIAYDDFGAGQARLLELSECPPDFLKLDMALVRDIHRSPKRHALVKAIIDTCQELRVKTIAEGVETRDESEMCLTLGCESGQGYYYGRPDSATALVQGKVALDSTVECALVQK